MAAERILALFSCFKTIYHVNLRSKNIDYASVFLVY